MTDNIELEDSPEEEIQEASSEVDQPDEKKSEQSVKAAEGGVKGTAPKRTAAGGASDNTKQDPMPKTKAGMMNQMFTKMQGMSKDQMQKLHASYHMESVDVENDTTQAVREVETNVDFSDDLNALVESEATLSAEFKTKAATIFEAAIRSKLSEEIDRIEDQYKSELSEEIEQTKADLVEKVDNYLNYVVENWMKENELAIQNGLRTEIAENFMNNLKGLFTESYIEVPEEKVDLVDDLSDQVAELEEQLNKQTEQSMEQALELEYLKRESVIRESAKGLAETQVEKLVDLSENVDFEDEESFKAKVETLKENYFKTKTQSVSEDEVEEDNGAQPVETTDSMSRYLDAIRKTDKN